MYSRVMQQISKLWTSNQGKPVSSFNIFDVYLVTLLFFKYDLIIVEFWYKAQLDEKHLWFDFYYGFIMVAQGAEIGRCRLLSHRDFPAFIQISITPMKNLSIHTYRWNFYMLLAINQQIQPIQSSGLTYNKRFI